MVHCIGRRKEADTCLGYVCVHIYKYILHKIGQKNTWQFQFSSVTGHMASSSSFLYPQKVPQKILVLYWRDATHLYSWKVLAIYHPACRTQAMDTQSKNIASGPLRVLIGDTVSNSTPWFLSLSLGILTIGGKVPCIGHWYIYISSGEPCSRHPG